MRDFRFYLIRLRRSSPGDIAHRVGERFRMALLKKAPGLFGPALPPTEVPEQRLDALVLPDWHGEVSKETQARLLEGETFTLGAKPERISEFEARTRGVFFADVVPDNAHVDIRCVWEPARMQHLALLLQVLRREPAGEQSESIREFVRDGVLSWIAENEFPCGPHYMSAMECGLRIPVLVAALKLGGFTREQRQVVFEAVYRHAWLIRRRLSLYSSLGNHTVCECVGLVFAAALFGNHGHDWMNVGLTFLTRELDHQVLSDGGPVEQSMNYHRFVLDLYAMTKDFAEKNALGAVDRWQDRLNRGERFLGAFLTGAGEDAIPNIGDSDDGRAIAPGLCPARPDVSFEWRKTGSLEYASFQEAGYTAVRTGQDVLLVFDHGPLGMPPLFNHGHADALSVYVYYQGVPFIVDAGTYSYNADPEMRRSLKGTRAHNTVTVDGLDQAKQLTGTVWAGSYNVRVSLNPVNDGGIEIEGSHDGYAELGDVAHTRRLLVQDNGHVSVRDSFSGSGEHEFELNYHLHPDVVMETRDEGILLRNDGKSLFFSLVRADFTAMVEANTEMGWFSGAYGDLRNAPVIRLQHTGFCKDVTFEVAIHPAGE